MLPNDFDELYAVARDPLVWEQHPASDRCKEEVFVDFFNKALASGGALVVVDKQSSKIIGSSRYFGFNNKKSEIEIGWTFLARSHWGGAYNHALKKLMLQHAFKFVNSVIFLAGVGNTRSRRALEKIGAINIALRKDAEGRDAVVYQITASAFGSDPRWKGTPS